MDIKPKGLLLRCITFFVNLNNVLNVPHIKIYCNGMARPNEEINKFLTLPSYMFDHVYVFPNIKRKI